MKGYLKVFSTEQLGGNNVKLAKYAHKSGTAQGQVQDEEKPREFTPINRAGKIDYTKEIPALQS